MSDIQKNTALVPIEGELRKKEIEIRINEKKSNIFALERRLQDLVDIEKKKIELQMEILEKEIEFLEDKKHRTIDVNSE